ncbi:MAG: DUF2299 family protein [Methanothrix sp.]
MSVETPEEASKLVRKWMEDYKVFKNDNNSDAAYFNYDGNVAGQFEFSIQQPKEMVRVVGVLSKMDIAPWHLEKLRAFDIDKRKKFIRDIEKYLLLMPPNFAFEPSSENPEWILFVKEITYDELTEGRLNAAVNQICRDIIFTSSRFVDELGEIEKE